MNYDIWYDCTQACWQLFHQVIEWWDEENAKLKHTFICTMELFLFLGLLWRERVDRAVTKEYSLYILIGISRTAEYFDF